MHIRISTGLNTLALLLALALPLPAAAVGLGAFEVQSHLNEPLQARIRLTGLKDGELDNLRAGLASEASFERAGLDRAYLLTRLKFSTEAEANGRAYIRIRGRDAMREPGLSLIVRVATSSAVHERRYDVLINLR